MDKEASSPTTIACHHLLRAIPFPDACVGIDLHREVFEATEDRLVRSELIALSFSTDFSCRSPTVVSFSYSSPPIGYIVVENGGLQQSR